MVPTAGRVVCTTNPPVGFTKAGMQTARCVPENSSPCSSDAYGAVRRPCAELCTRTPEGSEIRRPRAHRKRSLALGVPHEACGGARGSRGSQRWARPVPRDSAPLRCSRTQKAAQRNSGGHGASACRHLPAIGLPMAWRMRRQSMREGGMAWHGMEAGVGRHPWGLRRAPGQPASIRILRVPSRVGLGGQFGFRAVGGV